MKFVDALARAITGEVPRRIVVAGRGSLSVFPTQGAYVSDFHDLSGFEDFGANWPTAVGRPRRRTRSQWVNCAGASAFRVRCVKRTP